MAQNIEHKKSVLDDDASIYRKKEERDESKSVKQHWAEMDKAAKKQYFKDYMMKPLIVGALAVILIVYIVVSSVKNSSTTKFYFAVLNPYYMNNDAMQAHVDELSKEWKLEKREKAIYSTDLSLGDSASLSTFVTYLYAGTLNAVIGSKEKLEQYGSNFTDFKQELPKDILDQIPEEAFVELTYEFQDGSSDTPKLVTTCSAINLNYTVFADDINTDYFSKENDLILVIPIAGLNASDGVNYSYDFLMYALGIDTESHVK